MTVRRALLLTLGAATFMVAIQPTTRRLRAGFLVPAAAAQLQEDSRVAEGSQLEVAELLRAQRERGHGVAEELIDPLAKLAQQDPSPLIALLLEGTLPAVSESLPRQVLNRYQIQLGLEALFQSRAAWSRGALAAIQRDLAQDSPRLGRALGVLAAALPDGRLNELFRTWKLAGEPNSELSSLAVAFRFALDHRTDVCATFRKRDLQLSARTRVELATVLGDCGEAHGLPVLMQFLEDGEVPAHHLLEQVGRCGAPLVPRLGERMAQRMESWLDSLDTQELIAACHALGALDAPLYVERMLVLLEHESSEVNAAARSALCAWSGQRLPADPRLWNEWYEREDPEGGLDLDRLLKAVHQAGAADLASELRELSRHRIHRHRIARELGPLLDREQPETLFLTCTVLAELGSPAALEDLLRLAAGSEGPVLTAALAAFDRITGQDFSGVENPYLGAREAQRWWEIESALLESL